jgi:hypothetical protein
MVQRNAFAAALRGLISAASGEVATEDLDYRGAAQGDAGSGAPSSPSCGVICATARSGVQGEVGENRR